MKPGQTFRAGFAYSNILYPAAGELVSSISGETWGQFIEERIFGPLGMSRSTTSIQDLERFDNVASPHIQVDGTLRPIAYRKADNVAPAVGVISSAVDMARWLTTLLRDGQHDDTTFLDAAVVREIRAPQVIIRTDLYPGYVPLPHLSASGFGWNLQDYHDRLVVWHQGTAAGMASTVGFLPEESLAVVVLTNTLVNDLHRAVFWRAVDAFLGLPEHDWSAELLQGWMDPGTWLAAREAELRQKRVEPALTSVPLQAFVGVFEDSLYGEVELQMVGDHLALRYGGTFEGDLDPWYADAFRISWRDPVLRSLSGSGVATFSLDSGGEVESLTLDLGVFGRYEFRRK